MNSLTDIAGFDIAAESCPASFVYAIQGYTTTQREFSFSLDVPAVLTRRKIWSTIVTDILQNNLAFNAKIEGSYHGQQIFRLRHQWNVSGQDTRLDAYFSPVITGNSGQCDDEPLWFQIPNTANYTPALPLRINSVIDRLAFVVDSLKVPGGANVGLLLACYSELSIGRQDNSIRP